MNHYLQQLRNKSDEEKRRLVRIYAGLTTGIIVVIWILIRLAIPNTPVETDSSLSESVNTFETMFNQSLQDVQMTPVSDNQAEPEVQIDPEISTSSEASLEMNNFFDQEATFEDEDTDEFYPPEPTT